MRKHYCYLIQSNRHIKIGYSRNIAKRLETMQTGNPYDLKLIAKFSYSSEKMARDQEKFLHRMMRAHHFRGEWFYADAVLKRLSKSIQVEESEDECYAELELISNSPI